MNLYLAQNLFLTDSNRDISFFYVDLSKIALKLTDLWPFLLGKSILVGFFNHPLVVLVLSVIKWSIHTQQEIDLKDGINESSEIIKK